MTAKTDDADWSLATWEGSQRESLRRWAKLPLENIIAALEEMQALNDALHVSDVSAAGSQSTGNVQEPCRGDETVEKGDAADKKK